MHPLIDVFKLVVVVENAESPVQINFYYHFEKKLSAVCHDLHESVEFEILGNKLVRGFVKTFVRLIFKTEYSTSIQYCRR